MQTKRLQPHIHICQYPLRDRVGVYRHEMERIESNCRTMASLHEKPGSMEHVGVVREFIVFGEDFVAVKEATPSALHV